MRSTLSLYTLDRPALVGFTKELKDLLLADDRAGLARLLELSGALVARLGETERVVDRGDGGVSGLVDVGRSDVDRDAGRLEELAATGGSAGEDDPHRAGRSAELGPREARIRSR